MRSRFTWWMICAAILLAPSLAAAAEAFTDPAKAGPDFAVQGEYAGELKFGGETKKVGLQVVALGDSKFDGVLFVGGLPGDGWKRGDKQEKADGATADGVTSLKTADWIAKIADGKVAFTNSGGESLGTLTKVERKSPTLGEKPPAGALVLFDGSNADQWQNGKIVEDNLLLAGTFSKPTLEDYKLHVEFRTPFVPKEREQGRGNSGVYLSNRYEVQVLDSFGLEGKNNECGGIYSQTAPKVNMCLPPLSWQTYDADFTAAKYEDGKKVKNARVTLKHNGVLIYDDLELPGTTPGGQGEGPDKAPLQLQAHGNPVTYRNIWVVEKK